MIIEQQMTPMKFNLISKKQSRSINTCLLPLTQDTCVICKS